MALTDHVSVVITADSAGVSRAGFGLPMFLTCKAVGDSFAERIKFYANLAEVATDFAVTTSPEYLAAAAAFGQNPRPPSIAFGRAVGQPTMSYTLTVTAADSVDYDISVKGEGVTPEVVSYTSDATAIDNEITAGLKIALDAVIGKNYTVTDNLDGTLTVTGVAAADWFSLEPINLDRISAVQDHAEPGTTLATDLAAIQLESDAWYSLITLYNSTAYVNAAAVWIEAQDKIYLAESSDTTAATVAEASGTDVLDDLDEFNYERSLPAWHPAPADMFAARIAGSCLPKDPGSITWAYRELSGIAARALTSTQRTNLEARNATYFKSEAGKSFTWEGKRADGDYIDVTRGEDWIKDDMSKGVFGVLLAADKIPFTDGGAATMQSEVEASLQRAISKGILAATPAPVVTVPAVADVADADKTNRLLPDIKWSATRAGSIHKASPINGVISV